MFKKFWLGVSEIGLRDDYEETLSKRITLTNQFSVIACVIFIFSGINNYTLGDVFSALILEGFAAICIFGFYMTWKHYYRFSISFLFIAISTAIFYFDSYSGLDSGTFLYHFPLILAIAFVFDIRKDRGKMLFHFILILSYLAINVATHYEIFKSAFISDADRYQMFAFNLVFSSAAVGFFIYLTVVNNIKESIIHEQRIHERYEAEMAMKQALHEKEILLAELHHRVKNNLAVITGLFNLKLNTTQNMEARNVLLESRNRVKSMALIHDRLYRNDNLSQVNFMKYIEELVKEIHASYPSLSTSVNVQTSVSNVVLNIKAAVPCGLLLNELLTNCYKHAFTDRSEGTIHVSFIRDHDDVILTVKDNGVGLPQGYEQRDSMGMVIIDSLSQQLDGTYSLKNEGGTCFELKFRHH